MVYPFQANSTPREGLPESSDVLTEVYPPWLVVIKLIKEVVHEGLTGLLKGDVYLRNIHTYIISTKSDEGGTLLVIPLRFVDFDTSIGESLLELCSVDTEFVLLFNKVPIQLLSFLH